MLNKTIFRTIKTLPILLSALFLYSGAWAATPQCTYVDNDGVYDVFWTDSSDYKYLVERSVNSSPWYWRGAMLDNDSDNYQFTDNGNTAAPGSSVRYRLRTKAINNASPAQDPVLCQLKNPATPACAVTEKPGRQFDVSWQDTDVHKYIVERSINGSAWYWRGAAVDNNQDQYLLTDTGATPTGAEVVYRLQTKVVDNNSPKQNPMICEMAVQPQPSERFATANVNGRWEIVNTTKNNEVVRWNAVNVRSDKFIGNNARPLGAEDIQALATVFDTIRLVIHWDQLHIGAGQFNQSLLQQLRNVLDYAEQYDVNVILDPVHLGGGDHFWIPLWVWQISGLIPSRSKSFELLKRDEIQHYLNWIMSESGLGKHPAVVAIEVVNEPHPVGSKDAWRYERQRDLMLAYEPMVATIRQHRSDVIVVLGSYYGGHLFDNGRGEGNAIADVFGDTANLVWTAHNYFTGIEPTREGPDYDGDGFADLDGQGYRGSRGAGVWTESYDSYGCYAQNPPYPRNVSQCDKSLPLRNTARQGHANNAANHDRVAQQAGMPFFMGEFGMGRVRNNNTVGWSGTQAYMCDKLMAYKDIKRDGSNSGISWAVWAFDSQVDGGFGLYNSSTNRWVPDTSNAFFGRCE